MSSPAPDSSLVLRLLARDGHCFLPAAQMLSLLRAQGSLQDWADFASSWEQMPLDGYMADQGRYRRRRHAVFRLHAEDRIERLPAQPHYQSLDYNPLNGGLERWYEPIAAQPATGSLDTTLRLAWSCFASLAPSVASWKVEAHQFRIEARFGEAGQPTPEGVHRDGVDYVLVLLIRRQNIASGTTRIHRADGSALGSFTLSEPGDACLIDDARVFHGVTAVHALDPAQPAHRDVLVLTFRREA